MNLDTLERAGIDLTEDERRGFDEMPDRPAHISTLWMPYLNESPALRLQVVPNIHERDVYAGESPDVEAEAAHEPVPGLIHRYPDRALIYASPWCAAYCRFCFRFRMFDRPREMDLLTRRHDQMAYLRAHPEVRDVSLSGGDPLMLDCDGLAAYLEDLRTLKSIEIVRIHTRVPVYAPELMYRHFDALKTFNACKPLYINIHTNHPDELALPGVAEALWVLGQAGIPLGSQSVILKGVNDNAETITALMHALLRLRVRPYYLYLCDPVVGAGRFRTPLSRAVNLYESLRGHTSGLAVPAIVVDAPGGGGKIPLLPNYVVSQSPEGTLLRNYARTYHYVPEPALVRAYDQA
jgi:lysine 2,3-aminomutase